MCFGYVPIFIGGGEGLLVEQRGPVRGVQDHSVSDLLRSQKKSPVPTPPPIEDELYYYLVSIVAGYTVK